MSGRVIQGFFIGGAIRPQPALRAAAGEARPRHASGAPPSAFAGRAAPLHARMAPGRPPLAHRGAGPVAQSHGGNGSFDVDPVQLGLARGGGTPLPQALLAKMEAAFGADFSAVRVHVGPQAARIGAVAFTTGNDLYFAAGRYQPDSVQGQQLIGHELAHVVQQRQGRVRGPGSGVAVVQDHALEAEADRLGMRAAMLQARLEPGRSAPRSARLAVRPQAAIQRAKGKHKLVLVSRPPQRNVRLETIRARLTEKITPVPFPEITRPNKPKSLSRTHPQTREALTFHHKLNCEKLLEALRTAIDHHDEVLLEKLRIFARHPKFSPDFKSRFFRDKPSTVPFAKEFKKFQKALIWSGWNGFFAYVPEKRIDDPKHDLDSHYGSSGTVTPRTELAHAIGPGFALDVAELQRRLGALAQGPSEFVDDEWPTIGGMTYQKNDPHPALRIVAPDLGLDTLRSFVISVAANDATKAVQLEVRGEGQVKGGSAHKIGNLWKAKVKDLLAAKDYVLTATAYDDVSKQGRSTVLQTNFRVSNQRTQSERDDLVRERQDRVDVEVDLSGSNLFDEW